MTSDLQALRITWAELDQVTGGFYHRFGHLWSFSG
jgi:hypothetical protein